MKKIIAILLTFVFIFALCSCTDKENVTEEKKNTPAVTETQEETATEEAPESLTEEDEEPVSEPSTDEPADNSSVDDPNATEQGALGELGGEEGENESSGDGLEG